MNESGKSESSKEEWSATEHALAYLSKADNVPHRLECEIVYSTMSRQMQKEFWTQALRWTVDSTSEDYRPKMEAVALDTFSNYA